MSSARRSRRLTAIDPRDVYLNPDIRESDAEALARHRAYYDAAFATLTPTRHLVLWGGVGGLLTGLVLSAGLAIFLALLVNFEVIVLGVAPMSWGPPTDPAWIGLLRPAIGSLVLLPWFGLAGIVGALLRRWGHQRRDALAHYFSPEPPRADAVAFWFFIVAALWGGFWLAGLLSAVDDALGIVLYMFGAGGALAWPLYPIWVRLYLILLTRYSPVTLAQIHERVLALIGPRDEGPALPRWQKQVQTLFEARRARK